MRSVTFCLYSVSLCTFHGHVVQCCCVWKSTAGAYLNSKWGIKEKGGKNILKCILVSSHMLEVNIIIILLACGICANNYCYYKLRGKKINSCFAINYLSCDKCRLYILCSFSYHSNQPLSKASMWDTLLLPEEIPLASWTSYGGWILCVWTFSHRWKLIFIYVKCLAIFSCWILHFWINAYCESQNHRHQNQWQVIEHD